MRSTPLLEESHAPEDVPIERKRDRVEASALYATFMALAAAAGALPEVSVDRASPGIRARKNES